MTSHELPELREPLMKDERDGSDDATTAADLELEHQSLRGAPRRILSKAVLLMRPSHIYRAGKRVAYAFVPQIVRSRVWNDTSSKPKQFPTSYLNGLRGITAIKVFTFHYTFVYTDSNFQPWGTNDRHYYILELPIIRYLYAGFTAHVFFGIAGYLTSLRIFQQLDRHDQASQAKVLQNVSGALFRRAFRLYFPTFLVTLITAHYIYFGFYEANRPLILDHGKLFPGEWNEPKPPQLPYPQQMYFWAREMFDLGNIFTHGAVYPYHDQHLWSILAEMKGSLYLYVVLTATAQCTKYVRLAAMCVMTYMFFLWNHWEIWVYTLGAVVAQIDLLLTEREKEKTLTLTPERLPPSPPRSPVLDEKPVSSWSRFSRFKSYLPSLPRNRNAYFRIFGFVVAFYFLSYPIDGARDYAPGYMTLNKVIPEWMERKDKFYPNIGTALLLLLLARSDPVTSTWRRILNSSIPQYLGKISFAMYLVHGPLLHAFGYLIPHHIWWAMGTEGMDTTDLPWTLAVFIGWAISLTVSLWAADVWSREVESKCVKVVKKLEDFCFVKV